MTRSYKTKRINSVDALRALAIIPVIFFHINQTLFPGGYLGVDVFFVISGFIITGILLDGITDGRLSLTDFYARRIRRILPALLLMLLVVAGIWLWHDPLSFGSIGKLARSAISMRANYAVKDMVGDYWGGDAQGQPLLHTWSLAVEEQFYLIYPILLWGLWRYCSKVTAYSSLVIIAFASLFWYARCSELNPPAAFYDTTTRAWELLAGALVAVIIHGKSLGEGKHQDIVTWIGWAGFLAVMVAYVSPVIGISKEWRPFIAVMGSSAFLWGAPQRRGVHSMLDHPLLVYVGLISYSLYLWHWPVVVFSQGLCDVHAPGAISTVIEVITIVILGAASYHFIEKPSRSAPRLTWIILVACVISYFGIRQLARELDERGESFSEKASLTDGLVKGKDEELVTIGGFRRMRVGGLSFTASTEMSDEAKRKYRNLSFDAPATVSSGRLIIGGDIRSSASLLVWGDSHAMAIAPMLDKLAKENGIRAEYRIKDGQDPKIIFTSDGDETDKAAHMALRARPDCCIFIFRYDTRTFDDYEATFTEILKYTKLVVVQQPPVLAMPDKCTIDYFAYLRDKKKVDLASYSIGEQGRSIYGRKDFEVRLADRFGSNPGFIFIKTDSVLRSPSGRPRWWDGKSALFYIDDDHLSEFGALQIEPLFRNILTQRYLITK